MSVVGANGYQGRPKLPRGSRIFGGSAYQFPIGPRLDDLRPCRRTAFSLPRIDLGKTDDAPFSSELIDECSARQDHAIGNLIEDHPMTALGNVPCNGCRACCLHDMIPLMPERGDLIWTYEHEVIATGAGPTAVLSVAAGAHDCGLSRWRRARHRRVFDWSMPA